MAELLLVLIPASEAPPRAHILRYAHEASTPYSANPRRLFLKCMGILAGFRILKNK